jgi:hypothetical protein
MGHIAKTKLEAFWGLVDCDDCEIVQGMQGMLWCCDGHWNSFMGVIMDVVTNTCMKSKGWNAQGIWTLTHKGKWAIFHEYV